jgi:hypothetical protein
VYATSAAGLAVVCAAGLARMAARLRRPAGAPAGGRPGELALLAASQLLAPWCLALGYRGPALAALSVGALACAAGLSAAMARASAVAEAAVSGPPPSAPAVASGRVGGRGSAAAGLLRCADAALAPGLALHVPLLLFFGTGHFCEFSGLQYAASFVGYDSLAPAAGPALLALNTFGGWAAGLLALGGAARASAAAAAPLGGGGAGGLPSSAPPPAVADVLSAWIAARLLVVVISAALQQRHILLWAIFAPRLLFEALFAAIGFAAVAATA